MITVNYGLVARKLEALRKKKGLTQVRVAVDASIHPANLQRYLSGKSEPRIMTFLKILGAMGATLSEFEQVKPVSRKKVNLSGERRS